MSDMQQSQATLSLNKVAQATVIFLSANNHQTNMASTLCSDKKHPFTFFSYLHKLFVSYIILSGI